MKTKSIYLLIFALFVFVACKQAPAEDAAAETTEEAAAETAAGPDYALFDRNVAVVREFMQAHSDEDLEKQAGMLADTVKYNPTKYNGDKWLGKDEFLAMLKGYHDTFENITFHEGISVDGTVGNGIWSGSVFPKDQAMAVPNVLRVYGNWTSTHSESGKKYGNKWFGLIWVNDDGKIAQASAYFDAAGTEITEESE